MFGDSAAAALRLNGFHHRRKEGRGLCHPLRRGLLTDPAVLAVAEKHRATPIQVLLAWCIRDGHTIAIPRTGHPDHTLENAGANALLLDEEDLALIDRQYAPPTRKIPLDEQ